MTKSTWIEVIKKHTEPLEQNGLYGVNKKNGRKGYIKILVKDGWQAMNGGSIYDGLLGERVATDSDDILVLFYQKILGVGRETDVISYVL